jgi:hypothetical protein
MELRRVTRAFVYTSDRFETAGIILCAVFIPLFLLYPLILHWRGWIRFARHRMAEMKAAGELRGDSAACEELVNRVRRANRWIQVYAALTSLTQLYLILTPLLGPWFLRRHVRWETKNGLTELLSATGDGDPPAPCP